MVAVGVVAVLDVVVVGVVVLDIEGGAVVKQS